MKVNKKQWHLITNVFARITTLFQIAGERIQDIIRVLKFMARIEFEVEREVAQCSSCLFGYSGDTDNGHILLGGDCRESPPVQLVQPYTENAASIETSFPKVNAAEWCGHFRRRNPK